MYFFGFVLLVFVLWVRKCANTKQHSETAEAQRRIKYKQKITSLIRELSTPDLKVFAVFGLDGMALWGGIYKDGQGLVPELFVNVILTLCAVSLLFAAAALWSRLPRGKKTRRPKTREDVQASMTLTTGELEDEIIHLSYLKWSKHWRFNLALIPAVAAAFVLVYAVWRY